MGRASCRGPLLRAPPPAVRADQLKQHGGLPGIRDENALESALATSHPYADGNKRTALIAMYTFLGLNDLEITPSQVEVVRFMLEVAAGNLEEPAIADWLRSNTAEMEL